MFAEYGRDSGIGFDTGFDNGWRTERIGPLLGGNRCAGGGACDADAADTVSRGDHRATYEQVAELIQRGAVGDVAADDGPVGDDDPLVVRSSEDGGEYLHFFDRAGCAARLDSSPLP